MKIFPVIFCCAVAVAMGQSVLAADPGGGGKQGSPATVAPVSPQAQPPCPLPESAAGQAYDKNGKPMTPEEYAKANEARMKARSAASTERLKARQAKWQKKGNEPAAATKTEMQKKAGEPAPEGTPSAK